MSRRLPDDVRQVVDRLEMGPAEEIYRYSRLRLVLLWFTVVFLGPAVLLVAASLIKPVVLGGGSDPALLGSAMIFAAFGVPLALGWWLARWPKRLVVVCRDGFADLRHGAVREVVRWDAVRELSLRNRSPNRIIYGPDRRTYTISQGGLRLTGRCAQELTARGRSAPTVPPAWAVACLIIGIILPWLLIAPGIALNHRGTGGGLIVAIGGVPLVCGMIGLRHAVVGNGGLGDTGAKRAANIGCLAVGVAIVLLLAVGMPLMVALEA